MLPHRFRQYRAFDLLMRTGSTTRAADILSLSQPAVTKLLQSLENEVGIKLFDRTRRRLTETVEAIRLHREVERMLLAANDVDRVAGQIQSTGAGELRIAAIPMVGARFLPPIIARLGTELDALHMSLAVDASREVRARLIAGEADIGILHASADDEQLACDATIDIPGMAILPVGHHLADRSSLTPRDFEGERFVSLGHEHRVRDVIDELFEAHGVKRHCAVDTNLFESACEFVRSGAGVAVIDRLSAIASGEGVVMKALIPTVSFQIQVVRPASSAPSTAADKLIRLIRDALDGVVADGASEPAHAL